MKRPLLFLFFLTSLGIALLYPREYQPDVVFPQGQNYTVTVQGKLLTYSYQTASLSLTLTDCRIDHDGQSYQCQRLLVTVSEDTILDMASTPGTPTGLDDTELIPDDSVPLQADDRLSVTGSLSSIQPARNPGNFDWRDYYLARHISYRVYADTVTVLDAGSAPLRQAILELRQYLTACLQQLCPDDPDTAALLTALLLGDKTALEEETQAKYEDGGILHILTVSGLHVSLLGGAMISLGKKLHLPPWLRCLFSTALVLLYWQLCGAGLSAGRAAIMFLCLTAAPLLGRTYDTLSALALAGLFILWDSPMMVFQASFQLSFGAILGIQLVCPAFLWKKTVGHEHTVPSPKHAASTTKMSVIMHHIRSTICSCFTSVRSSLCFGLGLQLTLLPITLYHFFRYPLYGIFLNLLVLPLTTPLFLFGTAGVAVTAALPLWETWLTQIPGIPLESLTELPLHLSPGYWLLLPCRLILALYDWLCSIALTLPDASALWGRPDTGRIVCYYTILMLFCVWRNHLSEKDSRSRQLSSPSNTPTKPPKHHLPPRFPSLLSLLLILMLLPTLLLSLPSRTLSVTFLDVGQGDCAFLRTPQGTTVLIDCGSSDVRNVAEYRLIPFLESQGIDTLDYVFLSHTDEDHVNGVTAWLEAGYAIGTVILPALPDTLTQESSYQNLLTALTAAQTPLLYFHEGMSWQEGQLTMTCLAPVHPDTGQSAIYSDLNTASQVLLAEYQGIRILFTGDCELEGESLLLSQLASQGLTCHILKAGHHGSANATGQALLQQLQPQAVVISCGIRNRYGHPHPDMLARVEAQGSSCHVTASCGAVTVTIREGEARLESFLPAGPLFYR